MAERIYGDGSNGRIRGERSAETQAADREAETGASTRIRGEQPADDRVYDERAVRADGTEAEEEGAKETNDSSPLRKVAVGVGIAGLVGVGATAYAAHKTHEGVERLGGDIANAVGQVLMNGASELDRRIPAIGAPKPDKDDKENGWEFDV